MSSARVACIRFQLRLLGHVPECGGLVSFRFCVVPERLFGFADNGALLLVIDFLIPPVVVDVLALIAVRHRGIVEKSAPQDLSGQTDADAGEAAYGDIHSRS
ncbi:hypothetical protein TRVL_03453 [Trypanosoma vivax]|nr:hypothetical protein TRVL_03453 [Trypanosoma vivax]